MKILTVYIFFITATIVCFPFSPKVMIASLDGNAYSRRNDFTCKFTRLGLYALRNDSVVLLVGQVSEELMADRDQNSELVVRSCMDSLCGCKGQEAIVDSIGLFKVTVARRHEYLTFYDTKGNQLSICRISLDQPCLKTVEHEFKISDSLYAVAIGSNYQDESVLLRDFKYSAGVYVRKEGKNSQRIPVTQFSFYLIRNNNVLRYEIVSGGLFTNDINLIQREVIDGDVIVFDEILVKINDYMESARGIKLKVYE
ncbi:MAG: hypothetical protein ACK50N_00630 [Flavobacteriales bacterium]